MIETYDIVASNILTELRYTKNCYRVFGSRYRHDRRYKIKVISCCGNPSRDEFHIRVASYDYVVKVYRTKDLYSGAYYDSYFEIGYYKDNDYEILWAGGIYV